VPVTADAGATVTVNGSTVTSGSASGPIALSVGSNTITTIVTAQDGTTSRTYVITLTRRTGPVNIPDESLSVEMPIASPQIAGDGITVHQGLSPNGDGIHDFLQIDGIAAYPDNSLKIMNRDGALVFEAKGYNNSSKTFDGHSNKTGEMQLPGTYFYTLDYLAKGVTKHKTGFIVLKY
jgi:gliding motility-associated-like protein